MRLPRAALASLLAFSSAALHPAQAQQSSQAPGFASPAADILVLRDGTTKRGYLSGCDRETCRLGSEVVSRAQIEWIGFSRQSPPPPVREPSRDEVHLIDHSVQTGILTGIDSKQIYLSTAGARFTATSSLQRERAAWIHLGHLRPAMGGRGSTGDGRDETRRDERSTSSDNARPWRVPPKIYIWMPARCPTCTVDLHVLELEIRDDGVFLSKSRTVSVSNIHLSASWHSYDPPLPFFPGAITPEYLSEDSSRTTWLTEHHYLENRGGGASGGSRSRGGAGRSAPAEQKDASERAKEILQDPVTGIDNWAREAIARERTAQNARGGPSGGVTWQDGGRGRRQYSQRTGIADYARTVRMRNWQATVDAYTRQRAPGWERYGQIKNIPLYDVEVDLRFNWRDYAGRKREVDEDGYTVDTVEEPSGRADPAQPASGAIARPPPPQGTRPTNSRSLQGSLGEPMQRLREIAEDWARERLAEDAASRRTPRGPGPSRVKAIPGLSTHAIHLAMRWFRAEGRMTPDYGSDVISNVLEGRTAPAGYTLSTTLPNGALDMESPPSWPAANPRPPPRTPQFNLRP